MKTAVEQFAIALYEKGLLAGNGDEIQELLDQHLEMEKEQHEKTYNQGLMSNFQNFEHYYEKYRSIG